MIISMFGIIIDLTDVNDDITLLNEFGVSCTGQDVVGEQIVKHGITHDFICMEAPVMCDDIQWCRGHVCAWRIIEKLRKLKSIFSGGEPKENRRASDGNFLCFPPI